MNEYYIKVDFTKGRIATNLKKLVQNDYNSTKINFTFDKEGRVLFKMLYPDKKEYVTDIQNNELIFGAGILNQEGDYEYEIALYTDDGRLTDYTTKSFEVRSELVSTDELIEPDDRVPVLDNLINEVTEIKNAVENGEFNGKDYVITEEDYEKIANKIKEDAIVDIEDNSITPEKTSFINVTSGEGGENTIVPNFTNLADPTSDDWMSGKHYYNATTISDKELACTTNLIPCVAGDVLRFKGLGSYNVGATGGIDLKIQPFKADKTAITSGFYVEKTTSQTPNGISDNVTISDDGVYEYTCFSLGTGSHSYANQFAYVRVTGALTSTEEDIIVTINEEITYTEVSSGDSAYALSEDIVVPKAEENAEKIEKLEGKIESKARWFALGDSITEGYISWLDSSVEAGYASKIDKTKCWVTLVSDMKGYELTNHGVGGTGYLRNSDRNARRLVETINFADCDFVTLAYGVNDWKYAVNIGTINDLPQTEIVRNSAKSSFTVNIDVTNGITVYHNGVLLTSDTDYTVSGTTVTLTGEAAPTGDIIEIYSATESMVSNMAYAIKKILRDNPLCKIFVITPINCRSLGYYETNWGINYAGDAANNLGLEDIYQLEKEVCEYYGIELIDMTHSSIINRENIRAMLADFVHPTADAHLMLAKELAEKIKFK